jgi:hypothetical protein
VVPTEPQDLEDRFSINVTIETIGHLFHELDPSPTIDRDLDEQVESYILASAREIQNRDFRLVLHLPVGEMPSREQAQSLSRAINAYFAYRRDEKARELALLMREGRHALGVGFAFLFTCGALGWVALRESPTPLGSFLNEGLLIIGWVALWRPVEMLLYDWRPIRREKEILDALSRMPVQFRRSSASRSNPRAKSLK